MEVASVARASATFIRIAPRKVQIVLDLIRSKPVEEARAILKFTPKSACEPVLKLLDSAIANADNNFGMDVSSLYVAECSVSQGPTQKRIRPRAHGRAYRINKKTSHIYITLKEAES
ncbi:MAG: 50S ribosomal protein L22 [Clostridia bacterium]|nr:50S ribosomal protein L22 [Clostridia bacterium]